MPVKLKFFIVNGVRFHYVLIRFNNRTEYHVRGVGTYTNLASAKTGAKRYLKNRFEKNLRKSHPGAKVG